MGGFGDLLGSIGKLGLTGVATAFGGPLAGAGTAAGLGTLGSILGGGNMYEALGSGLEEGVGGYIGGEFGPQLQSDLLDILSDPNENPLKTTGKLDQFYGQML